MWGGEFPDSTSLTDKDLSSDIMNRRSGQYMTFSSYSSFCQQCLKEFIKLQKNQNIKRRTKMAEIHFNFRNTNIIYYY